MKEFQIFTVEREQEQPLEMVTVLRWDNASRGSAIGLTALYVAEGRPHAACCAYPYEGRLQYEFGVVSRNARRGERRGTECWNLPSRAVQYRVVEGAAAPGKSKTERLLQMKKVLERFKLVLLGWTEGDADRQELRLMPRPLFRY